MAVTFDLESVKGVVIGVADGPLTFGEIKECTAKMWQLQEGPSVRVLWDLRAAEFDLSAREVRESAAFAKRNSPYGALRMAFVASQQVEFGLLRMWEAYRDEEGAQIAVFREREQALEWLSGSTA